MAYSRPKQCLEKLEQFRRNVEDRLEAMGKNHAWLANETGYTEATISRLFDFARIYNPTERLVWLVCLALDLSPKEKKDLFLLLFPEYELFFEAMEADKPIEHINARLESNGLPPLNSEE